MKLTRPTSLLIAVLTLLCFTLPTRGDDITVETAPPVVVKTIPVAGAVDVDPATNEIKVTFSKEMADGSWSWTTASEGTTVNIKDRPHYEDDRKTCVANVKLEPGKTYAIWLNSAKFHGFADTNGNAAVPYLLVFKTKG